MTSWNIHAYIISRHAYIIGRHAYIIGRHVYIIGRPSGQAAEELQVNMVMQDKGLLK